MIGQHLIDAVELTILDVGPIVAILFAFQYWLTRRRPPQLGTLAFGLMQLVVGLSLFRVGLETSIVPMGKELAQQLSGPVLNRSEGWFRGFLPLCAFATLLGFTATLIEPTLIAIGDRVRDVSGGAFDPWRLRILVAAGVAAGLLLGTYRIIQGIPMEYMVVALVALLGLLAINAPRELGPLAVDSGAMATSVVIVPLIAAFGVAVADTMPGRDPVKDGFGMIVLALLMPGIVLLAVAQLQRLLTVRG